MNTYFVGLYSDAVGFRGHEFEKHGTCWNPTPLDVDLKSYENQYFGKIRELDAKYDLMSALVHGGIEPGDNVTYTND